METAASTGARRVRGRGAILARRASVAFGLGDGTMRIGRRGQRPRMAPVQVHDGAMLCLAPDTSTSGFLSGGDDGKFRRIAAAAGSAISPGSA